MTVGAGVVVGATVGASGVVVHVAPESVDSHTWPWTSPAASLEPSELDATDCQPPSPKASAVATSVHVAPASCDSQMLSQTAASFVPSALEAMSRQSCAAPAVTSDHVAPASPESHMFPLPTTAASVPPSALDVMDIQFCAVPTVVHDAPAS